MAEDDEGDKDVRIMVASELLEAAELEFDYIFEEAEKLLKLDESEAGKFHNFDEKFYGRIRLFVGRISVGEDTKSALFQHLDQAQFNPLEKVGETKDEELFVDMTFRNRVVRAKWQGIIASEIGRLRHAELDPFSKLGVARGPYRSKARERPVKSARLLE